MNATYPRNIQIALDDAQHDLTQLEAASASAIDSATNAFQDLAGQADALLRQAGGIVDRIELDNMSTALGKVQALCLAVKRFLEQRLNAVTTILETLSEEEMLLRQLASVTREQEKVSQHLRALSVFTNVEVAHLGPSGGDFQHLAAELSSFSKSLSQQTLEISADTEDRKQTVEETKSALSASLPQLRKELIQMEEDIATTQRVIESDLSEQANIPVRFRQGAEANGREIAGVIAAIQAHDITRQQIEHVQASLRLIGTRIFESRDLQDQPLASAGLQIQTAQLKNIKSTMASWGSQIERCMAGIRQLSASQVLNVGETVLKQEKELSSQLANIEALQQKSQEYGGQMQRTLSGLSTMAALINGHLQQSQLIRGHLQMLMFNSLIEASRLGRKGIVVSAIANLIRGVSEQWDSITEESQTALSQMMNLVKETNHVMEVFSEDSQRTLDGDREQTRATLDNVRQAAGFVAEQAAAMQAITGQMQANLADIGKAENQLEVCFAHLASALSAVEQAARQFGPPQSAGDYDAAEAERTFSSFYTTEIEREVMQAVLHGTPPPVLEQSFAGNSVELF